MQVEVEDGPTFAPITLRIVIESARELADLTTRLNLASAKINNWPGQGLYGQGACSSSAGALWGALSEICRERGVVYRENVDA